MTLHCGKSQCVYKVLATALLLAASARIACPQRLRGRVFEPDAVTPASQAGIVVRDSLHRQVWQGQTTSHGVFLAILPVAGTYTVSLLRVGYAPTRSDPIVVAPDDERYVELRLRGLRVTLPVVTVRTKAQCPTDPRQSGPLVDAWEQARAGLLAVTDLSDEAGQGIEVMSFSVIEQLLPRAETLIVVDDNRTLRGKSFRSRATTQLMRDGFVVIHADSVEYHAPDEHVLLDPGFIEHYCLWLEPAPAEEPHLVGIGLRPARTASADGGVEGVLWVRDDGRLVRFDFRYLGIAAVLTAARPGGTLRFRQIDGGRWIVANWHIRMPQAVTERRVTAVGSSGPVQMVSRLQRVVIQGGAAIRTTSPTGTWAPIETVSVALRVNAGSAAQRLAGTSVRPLEGGGEMRVSESLTLPRQSLVPGNNRFLVRTPLMRDAGLAAVEVTVPVLPDTQFGAPLLLVPSVAAVRHMLCGADDTGQAPAAAFGTVPAELRAPSPASSFWLEIESADTGRRGSVRAARVVQVDRDGHWAACSLPVDVSLTLSLRRDGLTLEIQRFRIPKGVGLAAVASPGILPWSVVESSSLDAPFGSGALSLVVLAGSDGRSLTDADVRIDDTVRVRFAVNAGGYRMHGLARGVHRLSVRRIGFTPSVRAIMLGVGATLNDTVVLARSATRLAEVVINGRRVFYTSRFTGVVERARLHSGALFTREDLRPVRDVKSLLVRLPGVQANDRGVTFARCESTLPSPGTVSPGVNHVQVYIDGVRATALPDDNAVEGALKLVAPSAIEFIEVYAGAARIPAEWQYDACAVIAIWTKRW